MADKRISQLIERTDIANNDVLPIVASGATTTNKVTISTIQEWMQDNLDVGVTSVGITLGSSGTDVNVTGSPITTSGNITINIPDASASARGVVTTGSQVFGGVKTFANGLSLPAVGGSNQITRIVNIGTLHEGTASLNQIGFNSGNNIYFGKGLSNGGVISWNNAAVRYYTLPDADGTIALTSQLDGYVTLNTAQTITAQKTFTTSGSSDTMIISHGSGSGIALDVIKAGNSEAIRVTKTSGSGNAVTISGGLLSAEGVSVNTPSNGIGVLINGRTSDNFSSIRFGANTGGGQYNSINASSSSFDICSLGNTPITFGTNTSGGGGTRMTIGGDGAVTLTGALNGTSASFTGGVTAANGVFNGQILSQLSTGQVRTSPSDGAGMFHIRPNAGSSGYITFTENAVADRWAIGITNGDGNFYFRPVNPTTSPVVTIASTGAATFSSSVTAGGVITSTGGVTMAGSWVRNMLLQSAYPVQVFESNGGGTSKFAAIGYDNSGGMGFWVNSSSVNVTSNNISVYISNSGNVGIGTASPAERLHIVGAGHPLIIASSDATLLYTTYKYNNTTDVGYIGNGVGAITGGAASDFGIAAATGNLLFASGGVTERMRITSGGNVGIGVTSPTKRLQVEASVAGEVANIKNTRNNTSGDYSLVTELGSNCNNTNNYHYIAGTGGADRLYIYGNGNVVNTNGSYGSLSDVKIKENIEDATPKLDDLMKVKVRNYNLIGDDKKQIGVIAQELEEVFPAMIDESEDFEEVEVPQVDEEGNEILNQEGEVVTTKEKVSTGTTTKSVKYSVFVPMLIKAMQEQQEQIKSLTEQVEALKSQING